MYISVYIYIHVYRHHIIIFGILIRTRHSLDTCVIANIYSCVPLEDMTYVGVTFVTEMRLLK